MTGRHRLLGCLMGLWGGLVAACAPAPAPPAESVAAALRRDDDAGFARATAPRDFRFPADHGPHEEFAIEWWYFTGQVETVAGRRFGYQLTFFRRALAPPPRAGEPPRASAWATRQAYLAHFAVSDLGGGRFHAAERLARGAGGLAEARAEPFRVAVADWSAELRAPASETSGLLPLRLHAADGEVAVDFVLEFDKPRVLHGDRGLSKKGGEAGAASYYYSFPRLATRGTLAIAGETLAVAGSSWMDREWSSGSLGANQIGWDWFSLQLDDRRELMLFELRSRPGSVASGDATAGRAGTLIGADGMAQSFVPPPGALAVLDHWTSPESGTRYPARWRWRLPALGLDLEVRPLLADQELRLGFRYWEGAVAVVGTAGGRPITGRGYVELTGYGDP